MFIQAISFSKELGNDKKTPGHPRTTWMKTTQQDLKSNNLSLNEAIDMLRIFHCGY